MAVDFESEEVACAGSDGGIEIDGDDGPAVALVDAANFVGEGGGVDPGLQIGGGFDADVCFIGGDTDGVGQGETSFLIEPDQVGLPGGGGIDGRETEVVAKCVVGEVWDAVVVVVTEWIGWVGDGV